MDTAPFFDHYYKNAQVNSIMIMSSEGIMLEVNKSFSKNFDYENAEIRGKHFSILFNEQDKRADKPGIELKEVLSTGQANDENYVVDKNGKEVWCVGESLLVLSTQGEKYIVKDIVNLQAKKQIQLFLTETEDLLQRIFESSSDLPMMILDGTMKIEKVNKAFLNLFEISKLPHPGSRLSDLDHPFWNSVDIKKEIAKILVTNEPIKKKEFMFYSEDGHMKLIVMDSKIIEKHSTIGRIVFFIIEDITPKSTSDSLNYKGS
jgi:PAS domain S-box-containing protein